MTVTQLKDALGWKVFHMADPDRTVTGGYAGDLLSWVMGRAGQDCACGGEGSDPAGYRRGHLFRGLPPGRLPEMSGLTGKERRV